MSELEKLKKDQAAAQERIEKLEFIAKNKDRQSGAVKEAIRYLETHIVEPFNEEQAEKRTFATALMAADTTGKVLVVHINKLFTRSVTCTQADAEGELYELDLPGIEMEATETTIKYLGYQIFVTKTGSGRNAKWKMQYSKGSAAGYGTPGYTKAATVLLRIAEAVEYDEAAANREAIREQAKQDGLDHIKAICRASGAKIYSSRVFEGRYYTHHARVEFPNGSQIFYDIHPPASNAPAETTFKLVASTVRFHKIEELKTGNQSDLVDFLNR